MKLTKVNFETYGRAITPNTIFVHAIDFKKHEIKEIQKCINDFENGVNTSVIQWVTEKIYVDFIGYNNPEYNDILICKKSNKMKLSKIKLVGQTPTTNTSDQATVLIKLRDKTLTPTLKKAYKQRLKALQRITNQKVQMHEPG